MLSCTPSCSTGTTQMSDVPSVIPQCRFYKRDGKCRYGENCKFSHDISSTPEEKNDDHKDSAVANPDPSTESVKENTSKPPDSKKPAESESASKPASNSAKHQRKKKVICKYYTNNGKCWRGNQCQFLHEKPSKQSSTTDDPLQQREDTINERETPQQQEERPQKDARVENRKPVRVCRFFKAGHCKKGTDCQFRHPGTMRKEADDSAAASKPVSSRAPVERAPVERPSILPTSMKIAELTDVGAKKLRETEIDQFKKRFPEAQLETEELVETYRIIVNPTDPDWPFEVRDFELWVSFPETYPAVPFLVDMPEDQVLPNTVLDYMVPQMQEWVSAKHGTNQVAGKVEIIFRPFLRWLDRKLESLFTGGARKFKKQVDAKAAGFEFVSNKADEESDKPQEEKQYDVPNEPLQNEGTTDDTPEDKDKEEAPPPSSMLSSNLASADTNRRGTEVLFSGLQLIEGIGTLICQKLSISIQCSKCKNRCEITTPASRANVLKCTKCQHHQQITFRPTLTHKFSAIVGFLDLEGCIPFDLVVMDCEFTAGCISCPKEVTLQGLQYGQTKTTWCNKCHQKMVIAIEGTKFHKLIPSLPIDSSKAHVINLKADKKATKDPAIQLGKPLPDSGTCKHFKKSFRWLRFPCCGKTYPCDSCHDENETDHEMKYAVRMICGFCCKEQAFSDKPCISCDSLTTRSKSQHWEGGKGCRNKTLMSKTDKQKYHNSNKTVSKKAQKTDSPKKTKPK